MLIEKFEKATPEKQRETFEFLYYNPAINAKVIESNELNPNKYILAFNERHLATITADNSQSYIKSKAGATIRTEWRGRWDWNPRFAL